MRNAVCALSMLCLVVSFVQAEPVKAPVQSLDDVRHDVDSVRPGRTDTSPRTIHIHNTFANKYAIREGDWLLVNTSSGYSRRKIHQQWEKKHGYDPENK